MALDLVTVPGSLVPDDLIRSDLQMVKRMMQLRWSVGEYLDAIAGNYGVVRPPLGFTDDDFFRSCLQVIMASDKNIPRPLWQLLEIALGPYDNLVFQLEATRAVGDTYITLAPELEYATYSATAGTFIHDEWIIDSVGGKIKAKFRYLDTGDLKVHFAERQRGSLVSGMVLQGADSGATVTLSSAHLRQVSDTTIPVTHRMPLYGTLVFEPGTANEETIDFVGIDYRLRRFRLKSPLTKAHSSKTPVFLQGGCWDIYTAQMRRIAVKIKCSNKNPASIPGRAYLPPYPVKKATLRSTARGADTSLLYADESLDVFPSTPFKLIIDPSQRFKKLLEVTVNSVNTTTRTLSLASPLPAGLRFIRGTEIQWYQTDQVTGGLTQIASPVVSPTIQTIKAICREENVIGPWIIIDPIGLTEELVFVTKTTYQRRVLTSEITNASLVFHIDRPLDNVPEGTVSLTFRVFDDTGYLGNATVNNVSWYVGGDTKKISPILTLAASVAFSTDIKNKKTYVELVDLVSGEVTLTLSRPLATTRGAGEQLRRFYRIGGVSGALATDAAHLPRFTWPPPASPDGTWPSPFLWDNSRQGPVHIRKSSTSNPLALANVARNDANDLRIYNTSMTIFSVFDPSKAKKTFNQIIVSPPGGAIQVFTPMDVYVNDASGLPTTAQVNAWIVSASNPNPGFPMQVKIAGEGGFGKTSLYYWGKGTGGAQDTIYVSGIQRIHQAGTKIFSYQTEVPIEALTGVLGVDEGLPLKEGYVLFDHTRESEELIIYDSLKLETPTRALMVFDRGFSPQGSHNPFAVSNIDGTTVTGVNIIRTGILANALARSDGFSFTFFLDGNSVLMRLIWLLDQVVAAGIKIDLYDDKDRKISLPALPFRNN